MKRTTLAVLASVALSGIAHGQSTLNWASSTAWTNGSIAGSYNALSNAAGRDTAGASTSPIALTYNFGSFTAAVSASLTGNATWQSAAAFNNSGSDRAPIVNNAGLFAFGIENGNTSTGGTLTFNFSQAVSLNSLTIGDLDTGGGVQDWVNVQADSGAFSITGSASSAPGSTITGSLIQFTGVTGDSDFKNTPVQSSGWSTISSGSTMFTSLTVSLLNGSGTHGIWLGNISVTAIPEPSTYALVLGVASLALIAARRRFARRS